MKFNIAHLDKVLLLQTLYLHAEAKGYGKIEYLQLLESGEIVEGMSTHTCRNILKQGGRLRTGYLIDYHNGKPLKIEWDKISRHHVIMDAAHYDLIHGKYRFLEALLNVFDLEEIWITDKNYRLIAGLDFYVDEARSKESEIAALLNDTVLVKHEKRGEYWAFDPLKIKYTSDFLKGLDLP